MRLEPNISVRLKGDTNLPKFKVEVKNIISFGFLRKVVNSEFKRQTELLEKGEEVIQETRGFNEDKGKTFSQRTKEYAHDYRYFIEPDIPPIGFDKKWIANIENDVKKSKQPRLIRENLINNMNISNASTSILVRRDDLREKFEQLIERNDWVMDNQGTANLLTNRPEYANRTVIEMVNIEEDKRDSKISDESDLLPIIKRIVTDNPKVVDDYKNGKEKVIQFLIGQVMKETKGRADAKVVLEMLRQNI